MTCIHTILGSVLGEWRRRGRSSSIRREVVKVEELGIGQELEVVLEVDVVLLLHVLTGGDLVEIG